MRRISFLTRLLDLIAPRACVICGCRLSITEELICGACNMHLPRTGFSESPSDNEMAKLFWGRLNSNYPIEQATALFRFEPESQVSKLIYNLKYHDHPEYGEILGRMVAMEQPESFFKDIQLIIPVPLTRVRQRRRGYNQSMMIAQGISDFTKIPIGKNIIIRKHFHESQTRKDWWERQDNVEGVFKLTDSSAVSGKHILIVDDVLTTGATILSCCNELLKAGDVRFSVLTLGFTKS